MEKIVTYIIRFLSGNSLTENQLNLIGYTSDSKTFDQYKLIIRPSDFFDKAIYETDASLPQLPLQEWESTPLLFGAPTISTFGETIVLNADIVASSFFMLSRYEEMVRNDARDKHGRFIGKESIAAKANFLQRPIVDEYGKSFRALLRKIGFEINEPAEKINNIYLTHDVDRLAHYRTIRGLASAILHRKEIKLALKSFTGTIKNDPWFTFPWLFAQNASLKADNCQTIIFAKTQGGKSLEDFCNYTLESSDFKKLVKLCTDNKVEIGLHASYAVGEKPSLIIDEKRELENVNGKNIKYNRHHFLRSMHPQDMEQLTIDGITDDFTIAYADVIGFRLGTTRCVKWINPVTLQLGSLNLHPLTIMECTLDDKRYMGLSETAAFELCQHMIEQTKKHHGDLTLLWHNTSVSDSAENNDSYQRRLYTRIIDYLKTI